MSYTHKVQVATLRSVDHLLLVEGDLEVLLDEYNATIDEVTTRDLFLSPWADDVIQHGLSAITQTPTPVDHDPESFAETGLVAAEIGGLNFITYNEQQLEVVRDEIDEKIDFAVKPVYTELACYRQLARGLLTLTGNKPWHHNLDSIAMKKLEEIIGDMSAGMDYGIAQVVGFKTTMIVERRVRDVMAIAVIGKTCEPAMIVTAWHDPHNSDCDRYFECIEEAQEMFEIECHHLKLIIAMDTLVQMLFVAGEKCWPGIEI